MHTRILITCFLLGAHLSFAQGNNNLIYKETAGNIVKTALGEMNGYTLLKHLCKIGPRLSGYKTSYRAIEWTEKILDSLGCDRVWLQSVMVPHWERGKIERAQILPGKNTQAVGLAVTALGGSVGTPIDGITAEVLEVSSFEELQKKTDKAKGKIIFFNRPFDQTVLHSFSGYAGAVKQRTEGAVHAARAGGVAALVRSVTSKNDNIPHTGVMMYADSIVKIPAAAIGVQDADLLSKRLKKDPALTVNLKLSCKNLDDIESYNVVGEIKGSTYPNDIIVVGAHLDAWDTGQGAHDDGTGVIQSIETLLLLKKLQLKPKRTIRCVLFIDEEQKQSGAKVYGYYASYAGERHIAAIESDRGGFTPRGFSVTADSLIIDKISSWLPYLNQASIDWVRKGGSGADISRIKNASALIGYVPDGQRYFDFHHSANDVFSAVHPREFELGSAAITILTYLISEEGL